MGQDGLGLDLLERIANEVCVVCFLDQSPHWDKYLVHPCNEWLVTAAALSVFPENPDCILIYKQHIEVH